MNFCVKAMMSKRRGKKLSSRNKMELKSWCATYLFRQIFKKFKKYLGIIEFQDSNVSIFFSNNLTDYFRAFGEIKALRMPKKMMPGENRHRGFCFVEYYSKSDAKVIIIYIQILKFLAI